MTKEKSHLSLLYGQRKNAQKQRDLANGIVAIANGIVDSTEVMIYDTMDKAILELFDDGRPVINKIDVQFKIYDSVLRAPSPDIDKDIDGRLKFLIDSGQLEEVVIRHYRGGSTLVYKLAGEQSK